MRRRAAFVLASFLGGAAASVTPPVHAQSYPSRPIHLVVPQPAGGHSDLLGRIVAARLSEILEQPVVVENRGGAGGTIAAEAVAHAPADGYTLLFAGSNNLSLASAIVKDLRYRVADFAPVGAIARVSYGLAVQARLPVTNVGEFVAYAREHPHALNYASSGVASTSHLLFGLLVRNSGIDVVHVPFKGSAIAINELVAGRVDAIFTDLAALAPLAKRGAVRLLAVAGERSRLAPDVATVTEQGFPELAREPWYGIVVPAATPRDIVATLSGALAETMRTPAIRKRFDALGFVPLEMTPAELGSVIRSETRAFEVLADEAGFTPER